MKNNNFFLFEKAKRQKTSRPRGRSSNNGGKREANFLGNKIKIFMKKERKSRKNGRKTRWRNASAAYFGFALSPQSC